MSEADNITGSFPKREKKKAETRKKIVDASIELFFERTLGEVTLEDVAERAGIHVQTLYRHFPNKASLMLAGDELWLERFQRYMAGEDEDASTFTIWRNWLNYAFADIVKNPVKYRMLYKRKLDSTPVMVGLLGVQNRYEDVLCDHLAQDFGMDADGIGLPRLVAAMLMAGHAAVIRRFTLGETDFTTEMNLAVDLVEEQFKHLIIERQQSRRA